MFGTKKAAREAGLRPSDGWLTYPRRVPRRDAIPVTVKGEAFFRESDCEEVISKTEASRRGLRVRPGSEAVTMVSGEYREYPVFRVSDCVAKRAVRERPPVLVDLLAAVFSVNKAAKRYRDVSQSQYRSRAHGLAGHSREVKEELYGLKDLGVMQAVLDKRVVFSGVHGGLALYRGEGYCFHSRLALESDMNDESLSTLGAQPAVLVESQPRGVSEARLKDAKHTLRQLEDHSELFVTLKVPSRGSNRRPRWRDGRSSVWELDEEDSLNEVLHDWVRTLEDRFR